MAKYDEFLSPKHEGRPVLVEAARRDGSGKNIENNYAKQNGYYQGMTVGVADQLSPYDDESGDDQDVPFILQATGTGNGTQLDFSTGEFALMKEKQGNTVVVNQLANLITTSDSRNGITATANTDGSISISGQATNDSYIPLVTSTINLLKDHKYLIGGTKLNHDGAVDNACVYFNAPYKDFTNGYEIYIPSVDGKSNLFIYTKSGVTYSTTKIKPFVVDLTQWFNGDIPQDLLDHPDNFFRYYQGSLAYNEGTLVNSNGRYIKCIGMNQWDEEHLEGYYDENNNGVFVSFSNYLASKNAIKVIPNKEYRIVVPVATYVLFYDKDKNYLSYVHQNAFTTPSNCCYIQFYCNYGGSTYNHDISVNLYYANEPRCLTYEPYQVLTNNDTGTEVLRSAGNVKDSKAPDGSITRRIGVVDLGTLYWHRVTWGANILFEAKIEDMTRASGTDKNLICPKYPSITGNFVYANAIDKVVFNNQAGANNLKIVDTDYNDASSFKSAMNGVMLYYELAEPTTEQGTPYSENINIDDFGTMEFSGEEFNGVPMGNKIFYPVDYKAFIDTLYNYTSGTPSNLVLQSERTGDKAAQASTDSALQAAVGGTLRQLLAISQSLNFNNTAFIDLGSLKYDKDGDNRFYNRLDGIEVPSASENAKIICTKYQTITGTEYEAKSKEGIAINISMGIATIFIYDTNYNDTDVFKAAMKGVLLAYKKAE